METAGAICCWVVPNKRRFMNSDMMMKMLLVTYFVISVVCLYERNYPRALYWVSAGMITFSVLWGMK